MKEQSEAALLNMRMYLFRPFDTNVGRDKLRHYYFPWSVLYIPSSQMQALNIFSMNIHVGQILTAPDTSLETSRAKIG